MNDGVTLIYYEYDFKEFKNKVRSDILAPDKVDRGLKWKGNGAIFVSMANCEFPIVVVNPW